jgi:hypothetical protein
MIILPVGPFTPVTPIAPVAPVAPKKAKAAEKSSAGKFAGTRPARSATAMASDSTRAALDEMKLGG